MSKLDAATGATGLVEKFFIEALSLPVDIVGDFFSPSNVSSVGQSVSQTRSASLD